MVAQAEQPAEQHAAEGGQGAESSRKRPRFSPLALEELREDMATFAAERDWDKARASRVPSHPRARAIFRSRLFYIFLRGYLRWSELKIVGRGFGHF